jgi:hypothetical protein
LTKKTETFKFWFFRAKDEARTRDNQLGRLELYQLSYFRIGGANIERKLSSKQAFWQKKSIKNNIFL